MISRGSWVQAAKVGQFSQSGDAIELSPSVFSEMVRNFGAKINDLPVDFDHASCYVSATGQPAPAGAFLSAMVFVDGGKVVAFATHDPNVPRPDARKLGDGLFCYVGEVTPLGEKLLPNYKYTSPAFVLDDADETGRPIGANLLSLAATNSPFLDGMVSMSRTRPARALRFSREGTDLARLARAYHKLHGGSLVDAQKVIARVRPELLGYSKAIRRATDEERNRVRQAERAL